MAAAAAKGETNELSKDAASISDRSNDSTKQGSRESCFIWSSIAFGFCVMMCVGIALYYNWESFFKYLFKTLEANKEHQVIQAVVLNGLIVIVIVCALPGPGILLILDGFFFGFWKGFLLGFAAEFTAYLISICLARTLLKASIREWLTSHSTLRELVLICEEDPSGKFLVLMRFVSVPAWAKNYTIGMMDLEWLKTVLVFIPGATFWIAKFAYIGYKSRQMAEAISKGDQGKVMAKFSGMELVFVGMSLTAMLLLTAMAWYEYNKRRAAIDSGETKPLNSC